MAFLSVVEWLAVVSVPNQKSNRFVNSLVVEPSSLVPFSFLGKSDWHIAAHAELRKAALKETDQNRRLELLCSALSSVGKALYHQPHNSVYLVNWANLRQLVSAQHDCALPYTQGDFREAVAFALTADPTNASVLFSAALIRQWAGEAEIAWGLFKRVLLLGVSLPKAQVDYIALQIKDAASAEAIIPARFPQVATWTGLLQERQAEKAQVYSAVLEKLQTAALEASSKELEQGKIPTEVHVKRISSLLALGVANSVRQKVDRQLSQYLEGRGERVLALYLKERASLVEIDVNRAFLDNDTRPLKSVLGAWNDQHSFALDQFYGSVGFYVPGSIAPRLIEVHAYSEVPSFSPSFLKIMVSSDNQRWEDVQGEVELEKFLLANHTVVAIRSDVDLYKYWKIHFASSARTRNFSNPLDKLVRVYVDAGGRS